MKWIDFNRSDIIKVLEADPTIDYLFNKTFKEPILFSNRKKSRAISIADFCNNNISDLFDLFISTILWGSPSKMGPFLDMITTQAEGLDYIRKLTIKILYTTLKLVSLGEIWISGNFHINSYSNASTLMLPIKAPEFTLVYKILMLSVTGTPQGQSISLIAPIYVPVDMVNHKGTPYLKIGFTIRLDFDATFFNADDLDAAIVIPKIYYDAAGSMYGINVCKSAISIKDLTGTFIQDKLNKI